LRLSHADIGEPAVTDLGGAVAGVNPALCEPITTVPERWPLAPAAN
jgi:hypothetical protein